MPIDRKELQVATVGSNGSVYRGTKRGGRKSQDEVGARNAFAAFLFATGWSVQQVADRVGMGARTLERLKNKPEFRVLVERNRIDLSNRLTCDFASVLAQEFNPSLDRLRSLRDQEEDLRVSLGATNSFMDRIVPKRIESKESTEIKISIDGDAINLGRQVMSELESHRRSKEPELIEAQASVKDTPEISCLNDTYASMEPDPDAPNYHEEYEE